MTSSIECSNRIKKVSGGVTTRTFFPGVYEEVQVGTGTPTAIKHYSFNGMTIAVRKGGVLRYTHTDHLGSSSGQTDTAGNAIADSYLRYYAYGGLRSGVPSAATTDRTFTGQKQDGTGLLYYNARFYDPALGVFLSPDTLVPDAGRVVDYNRFAYARNNPLKYTDPNGHTPWDVVDIIFWLMSMRDFQQNPAWGTAGWLALDTLTLLPIIPSVGGYIRRGAEAVELSDKITRLVGRHGDLALEFVHIAHKPGAMTLLDKLISTAPQTVKGAIFELEYARKFPDEIVEIGRKLNPSNNAEIDFVLENNVFVNVKNNGWSEYNPFVLEKETEKLVAQATSYFQYGPTSVKYVFKGGVPASVRKALETAGIIVEVIE